MPNVPNFPEFVTIIPTFYSDLENSQALHFRILSGLWNYKLFNAASTSALCSEGRTFSKTRAILP